MTRPTRSRSGAHAGAAPVDRGPAADGEARLTAAEVAADRALAEEILRLAPAGGPFDAVALVRDGRR